MELKTSLGDNKTLDIPLTWEGAPFSPVTGDTLIFTVKAAPTDADASALIQKITGGGGITFSGRTATVTLLHADTADLEPATTYFDIQHQDGVTGAVKTLTPPGSRLELRRDITRETTTSVTVVSNEPGSPGGPPQVKSVNFTAANNVTYHTTASLTITDPTPVEGRGYTVLVLAGTTTIGGVGYSVAGTFLNRVYEDGEWTTYNQSTSGSGDVSGPASAVSNNFASYDGAGGKTLKDSGKSAADFAAASHTHPLDEIFIEGTASVTINPTGDNNSILLTAVQSGPSGDLLSFESQDPPNDVVETIAFLDGLKTVVLPAQYARMVISGSTTPDVSGILLYAGQRDGFAHWTSNGLSKNQNISESNEAVTLYNNGAFWILEKAVGASIPTYSAGLESVATQPSGLSLDTLLYGSGVATITDAVSSAAQVIAAINASPNVSELLTASAVGDVTGAFGEVEQTFLTGGSTAITPESLGAESLSNKSTDVNADQASTTKYATVKAIYDWAIALFATITGTQALTNKRIPPRVTTIASSGTPTINSDNCDMVTITAQAEAITSMTSSLTGTPNNGEMLLFRIKDDGTARAITWGASFKAFGAALPTTTVLSKTLHALFIWDSVDSKWGCLSTSQEA
jgi:hypothetical protein